MRIERKRLCVLGPCDFANVSYLRSAERSSILIPNIVEPHFGNAMIIVAPRIPRHYRLGLARDEAPIMRTNLVGLEVSKHWVESRADWSRHILSVNQRSAILLENSNTGLKTRHWLIRMERDNITLTKLEFLEGRRIAEVTSPDPTGNRLNWPNGSNPTVRQRQNIQCIVGSGGE